MTSNTELGLLTSRDAGPVEISNRDARSLFLLLGDHAGNRIPARLANLGLAPADLKRHIAFDIGVANLGHRLSRELDAPFIAQRYSRLVIDCNRALSHSDSIAEASDRTAIPGNTGLTADERSTRALAIHKPYHEAIADLLAARDAKGLKTIIVSLHSFTPSLAGIVRPWDIGVLYGGGNEEFAKALLSTLSLRDRAIGENLPYQFDETDFTVPEHAFGSRRPYVELEIRQDALESSESIAEIAEILSHALSEAAMMIEMSGEA